MAAVENRKKNDDPSRPNCSGSSFNSVMIGTPARPTTILSAKLTSMNKNRRNVMSQAPLGVGCAVMVSPGLSFAGLSIGSGPMLPVRLAAMQLGNFEPDACAANWYALGMPREALLQLPSRSRRRHDWDRDLQG